MSHAASERGHRHRTAVVAAVLAMLLCGCGDAADRAAAGDGRSGVATMPAFTPRSGLSGRLVAAGSEIPLAVMASWRDAFERHHPDVAFEILEENTRHAVPVDYLDVAHLVPMFGDFRPGEVDYAVQSHGRWPVKVRVAIEAVAIYVHEDNPIERLTRSQADAVFTKIGRGGPAEDITTWGQLGLAGAWAERPINLYGRDAASVIWGHFEEGALFRGDAGFEGDSRRTMKELPSAESVVRAVAADPAGIGCCDLADGTAGVKAVALAAGEGGPFVAGDVPGVQSGAYPLARSLYLVIDRQPGRPIDPLVIEFLRLVLSQEGQQIAVKDGYVALPATVVREELEKLR